MKSSARRSARAIDRRGAGWELWRNLGDDGVRKAAYRGG